MAKFEVVSKYEDSNINIPVRSTKCSAGYDFEVAEDIMIPPYASLLELGSQVVFMKLQNESSGIVDANGNAQIDVHPFTLKEISDVTKEYQIRPTLVPTGIKCQLADDEYLQLAVRSSCPLKSWLILANGIGIIDADYYNNPDNEGEIFFQIINMSPIAIQLKKGDKIGQGIILKYNKTEDDAAGGERNGGFGSTDETISA